MLNIFRTAVLRNIWVMWHAWSHVQRSGGSLIESAFDRGFKFQVYMAGRSCPKNKSCQCYKRCLDHPDRTMMKGLLSHANSHCKHGTVNFFMTSVSSVPICLLWAILWPLAWLLLHAWVLNVEVEYLLALAGYWVELMLVRTCYYVKDALGF